MNLKKNFERFFNTKLEKQTEAEKANLTESQMNRFSNLSRTLAMKYPHAPLTLKSGFIWMGNKKIQPIQEFLKKSALQIQEEVRAFSVSGKKGLI